MIVILWLTLGACIGFVVASMLFSAAMARRMELRLMIQLDATQPVKISAVGKDAEGNDVNLAGTNLALTATPTNDKEFGTLNDEQDTFNPGEAGATGTITGTVTIDEVLYTASVDVELVAGGLASIALEFTPEPE